MEEKKKYTEEEIRQMAEDFIDESMPKYELKICEVCGVENCIYNQNCIKCNCQF